MFKDSITAAFEKARSEVGGKSMMVFFSIIAIVTAFLAFWKIKQMERPLWHQDLEEIYI